MSSNTAMVLLIRPSSTHSLLRFSMMWESSKPTLLQLHQSTCAPSSAHAPPLLHLTTGSQSLPVPGLMMPCTLHSLPELLTPSLRETSPLPLTWLNIEMLSTLVETPLYLLTQPKTTTTSSHATVPFLIWRMQRSWGTLAISAALSLCQRTSKSSLRTSKPAWTATVSATQASSSISRL